MDDLRELYQQVILDHNKNPKNFGILEHANRTAEGYNPLCGDRVNLYVRVEDDCIKDISFTGSGCAISKASASVMTTELKDRTISEADQLFQKFHALITGEARTEVEAARLGKLAIFAGVREFPMRVKCASLAWHTVIAAIKEGDKVISTE